MDFLWANFPELDPTLESDQSFGPNMYPKLESKAEKSSLFSGTSPLALETRVQVEEQRRSEHKKSKPNVIDIKQHLPLVHS